MTEKTTKNPDSQPQKTGSTPLPTSLPPVMRPASSKEFGGQKGPEPTRYGDWEKNGRCTDF